ncbi:hypothetical protein MNBD_NITROSPINAE01-1196 [hydrothermal vent metagenome]|uniref:Uncharacterized protein n=1 Tax=hydrothermal vent metagenome TaxID=652676 RepID=A0A3B1BNY4_9ZZZZ
MGVFAFSQKINSKIVVNVVFRKQFFFPLVLVALVAIVSCGGGGGGGTGSSSVSGTCGDNATSFSIFCISPVDNSAFVTDSLLQFVITNLESHSYTDGKYSISIFADNLLSEPLEEVDGLTEDENGTVTWAPTITLGSDKVYYWRFSAVFTTSNNKQELETGSFALYTLGSGTLNPIGPRNSGHMDINLSGAFRFAVANLLNSSGPTITYDFELYRDPDMTDLVDSAYDVPQVNSGIHTSWITSAELAQESFYYWRVKPTFNGTPLEWSGPFYFQVKNYCELSGPPYAYYAIEWWRVRECNELLFTNMDEALGRPNASGLTNSEYRGFLSIDFGGELVVEMGSTVLNGSGNDIRVYEYVSTEFIEVFAGMSETGPWYSLGSKWCGEYCDFDLGAGGVSYAKYIKVKDLWHITGSCHASAGADIDAITEIHPFSSSDMCG